MKKISIKHFNFSTNTWLRGLEFYRVELRFLEERLGEIAGDNTGKVVAVEIEYFQNQVIIHREQLDLLKHRIHELEGQLEQELAESPFVSEQAAHAAASLAKDYATEEKLMAEMRHAFNRFAAEWM